MDHLSCSQMNLYLQCSLKYKFQYIDKFPKPFKPSGLTFGGSIHAALAWLHKQRMNEKDVSVDKLYRIFDADWYAQTLDTNIRYKNGETDTRLAIMAKEMLSLYFVRPHRKPAGAEVPFTVPLVNTDTGEKLDVNLEGYIDLIEEGAVTEFKTSSQTMNQSSLDNHLRSSQLDRLCKDPKAKDRHSADGSKEAGLPEILLPCQPDSKRNQVRHFLPSNKFYVQGLRVCKVM